jgi:hypothetical protein
VNRDGVTWRLLCMFDVGVLVYYAVVLAREIDNSNRRARAAKMRASSPAPLEYPAPPDPLNVFHLFERYNRLGRGHFCFTGAAGQTWCTLCGLDPAHRIHDMSRVTGEPFKPDAHDGTS